MSEAVVESKTMDGDEVNAKEGEGIVIPPNMLIQGHAMYPPRYSSEHQYIVDAVESLALKKDYPTIFMKVPDAIKFHLGKIFPDDEMSRNNYLSLIVENSSCSLINFINKSKIAPFVSQYGISAYAVPKPFSGKIAAALIRHYMRQNPTYTKRKLDQLLDDFEISVYFSSLEETLTEIVALTTEEKDDIFVDVIESITCAISAQNSLLQVMNPGKKIQDTDLKNIEIFLHYAEINKKCPLLLLHNISSNQLLSRAMTEIMTLYKDTDSQGPMELFGMLKSVLRFLTCYIADYEVGKGLYYFGRTVNETGCKIDFLKQLLLIKKLDETILNDSSTIVDTDSFKLDLDEVAQTNAYYDGVLTSSVISCAHYLSNPDNKSFLEKIPSLSLLFVKINGWSEMEIFIRKYYLDASRLNVTSIELTKDRKNPNNTRITITPSNPFGSNKIFKALPLITSGDAQMQLNYGDTPLSAAMQPGAKIYGIDQMTNTLTTSSVIVEDCGYKKNDGTIFDTQSNELSNNILDLTSENFDLMFPACPMRKKVYLYCRDQIRKRQISSCAIFAMIMHALGEHSINMILIACLPYPTVGIDIDKNGNYVFDKSDNSIKPYTVTEDTQDYYPPLKKQAMPSGDLITEIGGSRKSTRKRRHSKPRRAKSKKHKKKHATKKKRRPHSH